MYIMVSDAAKKWNISEQMVRRYCIQGRIQGAYQEDEVWFIPEDAEKPERKDADIQVKPAPKPQPPLVKKLRQQKTKKMYHGLYDYVQTNLTYSNGRMASNRLMLTQITEIFETDKVKTGFSPSRRTTSSRLPTTCSARLTSSTPSPWNESSRRPGLPGGSWIT